MSEISRSQGILFFRKENGELGYFENGDEDKDRKYVGEIENGLPNGQGTYTWSDGRKCVGEYKDGKLNGQGIFTDPNGTMYVGKYKDGKKHGQGTYIKPEGRKYVGEWKDGERWNGTLYDKEGKIIGKFMNGWFDQ
jgi:hypothetical protein